MKYLIITVAGTATRFNRDTKEETLKCLYYTDEPQYALLAQLLKNCGEYDKYILVGGYLYEKLGRFVKNELSGYGKKIELVYNEHFKDYGSGYSLYKGIEAIKEAGDVTFVEGDLFFMATDFRQVYNSPKSVITINREPIYSNKAVALYINVDGKPRYLYDTNHQTLTVSEPFKAIFNSGQMWKFSSSERLLKTVDSLTKEQLQGTNLEIIQAYFSDMNSEEYDVVTFTDWFNCNTVAKKIDVKMNMAVLERDYRIDGIKWLLIVLVTFGHVIEPALSNPIANKLYSIIYIFHMPLFVFISGYYANVKDKEKLISKGFMLLETFLVVMIPQCFYYGSIIPLLNPKNSGWYLISLITWYIIFLLIINKLVGKIVVQYNGCGGQLLIFSCLLAVFAYMLPLKQFGNLLSFQRSCMFLPFFMMGFLRRVKGLPIIPDVSKCIKLVLAIASLVCFAFCLIYSGRILHVLEFNNANVWHMSNLYNQNIGMLLVLKVLVYIGSIITTFAVLMFVNLPKSICAYGSKTLAYYVIQGMFAHILSTYLQVNFYQALFLCVCILVLTTVLLRFVDSKFITNPFSTLLKWKY